MQNDEVKEQLAYIVRVHGQSIAEDPPKLQGLLRDLVGAHRREINVLMQAVRSNVPEELVRSSGPTSLTAERLANKLQEDTGLAQDAAQWAVATWGNAMGIPVEFAHATETVEPPKQDVPPVQPAVPSYDGPARPQTTSPTPPPVISSPSVSTPPASNPPPQVPVMPQQQQWQPQPQQYAYSQKKGMSGGVIAAMVLVAIVAIGGIVWAVTRKSEVATNPTTSPSASMTFDGATPRTSPSGSETSMPSTSDSPTASPSGGTSTGTVENGVYTDAKGRFTFEPPAGWTMTTEASTGAVQWEDTAHSDLGARMDVRTVDSEGATLDAIIKATEDALKVKINFQTKSITDGNLGSEKGKLIFGSVDGNEGKKDLAMLIAIHNNEAVVVSMGVASGKLGEVSSTLDKSLGTWQWK